MLDLRRRDFITLLGGVAPSWPLAAGAQQADRVRRIGVLMPLAADDREAPARIAAFHQGLQQLGWNVGRNVRIEYRWGAGDPERIRKSITELIDLAPDVILAGGSATLAPLLQATRAVPIVFVHVPIRSAPALSTAWGGQAAMPPVLPSSNTASVENGWSCSSR